MTARYDVVLFGATGFTGRRAAAYLAEETRRAGFTLALAGRDGARLEALAQRHPGAAVIVADGRDAAAARRVAAQARVVVSTAGPFAVYSDALVTGCVAEGAHYTDITGETPWVRSLIDRHHEAAAQRGLRLVPFCGFDSVPGDLGALLAVAALRRGGVGCRRVRAFYTMRGGANGGSVASALLLAQDRGRFLDPTLLEPAPARAPGRGSNGAGLRWEPDFSRWSVPFFMAPINVAVVRRSAALARGWGEPYGAEFAYAERLLTKSRLKATSMVWGARALVVAMATSAGRAAVRRFAPAPGTGPSEASVEHGFFRTQLVAEGEDGRTARVEIRCDGDPGNHATVRFLGQAALALARDPATLPGGAARGGVLTPATAFGLSWVDELRRAGIQIESS